ncbi:DUF4900 domain-containing protein [Alkaliphilus pronyensis]|uniref:DUF4900 domain-containing protein n=1 Tax=Alkaliphilus pronyensis TaxID=1482732 RepID=A0A6I0FLL9_9FIRM|nr:DUF4900 domain-containing protein [Alkaliphilus pronyensis]KAB3537364.1 DUF4900 domain-containing protein [Alkaliphilus pronyensis]
MLQKCFRSEDGLIMPIVLVLIMIIMLYALSAISIASNQTKQRDLQASMTDALHYAEAGVHRYLWSLNKIEADQLELDNPFSFGEGKYIIEIIENGEGTVRLRSTGWANSNENTKRTIEAQLTKRTFTQNVYLSNNDGSNIWWTSGDTVYGPMHTNTKLRVWNEPVFYGRVTHSNNIVYYPSTERYEHTGSVGSNNPQFLGGIDRVQPMIFPESNTELLTRAEQDGYVYYGRTSIMLNSNGTITTRNGNRNGGSPETRPLPNNGVIYINGTSSSTAYESISSKFNINRGNAFISGTLSGKLTIAAANNIYVTSKDPTNYNFHSATDTGGVKYSTTGFSLNSLTGEVNVTDPEEDILGLIANNYIWVLTTGWFTTNGGTSTISAANIIEINAAIFAINGGFGNDSADSYNSTYPRLSGTEGTIIIRGALIQDRRYPVAWISWSNFRGYNKDYAHDPRMLHQSPPHFIEPTNAGWEIFSWREVNQHVE